MNTIISTASTVFSDQERRLYAVVLGTLAVAILFAFWDGLSNLTHRALTEQELGHSIFLPAVAAWMLWERKDALTHGVGRPVLFGFVPIGFGIFLLLAGEAVHVPLLAQVGLVAVLFGLPFALGGRTLGILSMVPIAYLFFMVPPPHMLITMLSQEFQLWSSQLGAAMIRAFDIPVFLAGNVIHLPSKKLEVVEACSGLNYLFPFLSLGALAAYFYTGPIWQRAAVFLSTIPITIGMNSFRIAMTGVLTEKVGGNHTEGFVHMFEGWVVFVLCIILLMMVIWGFTIARGEKGMLTFVGFDEVPRQAPKAAFDQTLFLRNGVIIAAALVAAGVTAHTISSRDVVIPERREFGTLPLEFPEWRFRNQPLTPLVIDTIGADDYIVADMVGPEGEQINIYMAYLDARRDGKSWHSPMQCLPGGGWQFVSNEPEKTARADGTPYFHNRMIIQQGDDRRLVYYWYEQRGRKISNEFMMRFWVMWDDFLTRRSDGAMVRLMTRIGEEETVEAAEARLDRMRLQLEEKLPAYIPPR